MWDSKIIEDSNMYSKHSVDKGVTVQKDYYTLQLIKK